MTKSLVTGAAGFMGSHVARHCLSLGHEVVALDDLSGGFRDQVPAGAVWVEGSVTDHPLVDRLFEEHGFDYVYHLAAYAAEGLSHFIRRFNYTNNVIGSVNLINAAVRHEIKCFVFTSSIAVYGKGRLPLTEEMTPAPEDPYGIAKYAVELDLRAAREMFGLAAVVFRPHNVYGEHQNLGDRYRNVAGIFMNQLMQGKPLTVFGDGEQTRAFTYIDEVAPLIARCVERREAWGEVFNLGSDQVYTINHLARVVGKAFAREPVISYLPERPEVKHAYASHEKAERVFGRSAGVPLAEGIARMAAWARVQGPRQSRAFAGVEVSRNLPMSWREALTEEDPSGGGRSPEGRRS